MNSPNMIEKEFEKRFKEFIPGGGKIKVQMKMSGKNRRRERRIVG